MAAAPLFATIGVRSLANTVAANTGKSFSANIYTRLGVRPFINGRGTWTYLSGSLELPEVRQAAGEAAHYFVDMFELQAAAGRHLAKLSGAEAGMVTSGSAGAMAAATAACIAGPDPKNVWQLPDTTGLKSEVVMLGGRNEFDSAIRLAGGKLVVANTVDDLQPAITPQTAMVYTTWRDDRLESALKINGLAVAQTPVNPAQPDHLGLLPKLQGAKIGVIANQIFLSGKLLSPGSSAEEGELSGLKAKLDSLAEAKGVSLRRLLIEHALAQPGVASVLTGATNPDHLKQNVADALALGALPAGALP